MNKRASGFARADSRLGRERLGREACGDLPEANRRGPTCKCRARGDRRNQDQSHILA